MIQIQTAGYTRIQRRTAERLYNAGQIVYLLPCRMDPRSPWACPAAVQRADDPSRSFAAAVAAFTYYNCNYRETGYYPAFYVR